jgi:hypothetical protein
MKGRCRKISSKNGVPERQKSSYLKIAAFETQAFLAGITFAIYFLMTRPDLNDFLSRPRDSPHFHEAGRW